MLNLNRIIAGSLRARGAIAALALLIAVVGTVVALDLPVDVLPDLDRPRVVIMTEAHGLVAEDVERLVTRPVEQAMNGATGVDIVRSASGPGFSVVFVEFGWGTEIFRNRQIVQERLATATRLFPPGVEPELTPVSSIMGQILHVGLRSDGASVDRDTLRTWADTLVKPRLLAVSGVAQVVVIGGAPRQLQVRADARRMQQHKVSLAEVAEAIRAANQAGSGGVLPVAGEGPDISVSGFLREPEDLAGALVRDDPARPVRISDVAEVVFGPSAVRVGEAGIDGRPGVILVVYKQPGIDTTVLTDRLHAELDSLKPALPKEVEIVPSIFEQAAFVHRAMENVTEAVRDGAVLVLVILFLFLLNIRTTAITLTAIPLSIAITALVFKVAGLSINTMTLGGIAVAIGVLVDDAIVDVENIFRRLRQNREAGSPVHPLLVVYRASSEVRKPILVGTLLVVVVYAPLFALTGMEGRLFTPIGVAYVVSILASLVVSLTITPISVLLALAEVAGHGAPRRLVRRAPRQGRRRAHDGLLLQASLGRGRGDRRARGVGHRRPGHPRQRVPAALQRGFGAGRDEPAAGREPGDGRRLRTPAGEGAGRDQGHRQRRPHDRTRRGRRARRAREHVARHGGLRPRLRPLARGGDRRDPRAAGRGVPRHRHRGGAAPGAPALAHALGRERAGGDQDLRPGPQRCCASWRRRRKAAIRGVPGVADLYVEPQVLVRRVEIVPRRDDLARRGLRVEDLSMTIEHALEGGSIDRLLVGSIAIPVVLRLREEDRGDLDRIGRLLVRGPGGASALVEEVADVRLSFTPTTVKREGVSRRIVVQHNVQGRSLGEVVADVDRALEPLKQRLATMPGWSIKIAGQFEAQQAAEKRIVLLSAFALLAMFFILFTHYRSGNLALQVLASIPMALIGAVVAVVVTGQTVSIAVLVGIVSLAGIAARNCILLVDHYLHLMREEGRPFSVETILRAGKERLVPVLMTALTAGIALVPIALTPDRPGRELVYPVATVILGGLVSSTLLDLLVTPGLFLVLGPRRRGAPRAPPRAATASRSS